jgi:hypothetical protein
MSSLFENVCPHFTRAIFLLRRPCCVPLCVTYLVGLVFHVLAVFHYASLTLSGLCFMYWFKLSRFGSYIWDSIVTGYGLDDQVSIPGKSRNVSLYHHVQPDSKAHETSYPIDTKALRSRLLFLIGTVRGGIQLGPLATAARGRGNRSTRRKPAPAPLCPPRTPHASSDANSGRRGGKPATNRLSYGTA